jgi:hypothetical protein
VTLRLGALSQAQIDAALQVEPTASGTTGSDHTSGAIGENASA